MSSVRLLSLTLVTFAAMLFHTTAFAMGPNYSGSWYNPAQSGHGFSFEYSIQTDGTPLVVAYWYVYDSVGNPIFLIGVGEPEEGNTVSLEFDAPYGMKFGEFDPETTVHGDGGTGVFTFANEESGVFNYQPSEWIASAYGLSAITTPVRKLLGVAHPNDEPPPTRPPTDDPVPVPGTWSGRMIYNRESAAGGACYDADVQISTYLSGKNDIHYMRINTVSLDVGIPDIVGTQMVASDWQGVGAFTAFEEIIEFTLIFNDYGYAEGIWSYRNSDCYGDWTFTKG
jgi:hypothetical protein